jgi:thiamine-triphosphatase
VVDKTDFGHTVGEVELQQEVDFAESTEEEFGQEKQKAMEDMDQRIARFMDRYSWAFTPGEPKGKLTAYFEQQARQDRLSTSDSVDSVSHVAWEGSSCYRSH